MQALGAGTPAPRLSANLWDGRVVARKDDECATSTNMMDFTHHKKLEFPLIHCLIAPSNLQQLDRLPSFPLGEIEYAYGADLLRYVIQS